MYKEILKKINDYGTIIIHRHQKPDGDALGSQFGLKEILKNKFPNKRILIVGEKKEFENNSLKNIFKVDFDTVEEKDYVNSLVIVVDTANVERIMGNDFFRGETVIKIDHHDSGEHFGDIELVEAKAASTAEIISRFANKNKLDVNEKAAKYLMTGMITDTGRFMFNSVTPETFKEVYNLSSAGARTHKIVHALNDRTLNFQRLQGQILKHMKFNNGVVYYMMPKYMHKLYKVDYNTAASMVFVLMSFKEANYALFATYDSKKGYYKASLRSRKKPVNKIAEEHRGGGHEMASGLKLKNKKEFKEVLNKLLELNK